MIELFRSGDEETILSEKPVVLITGASAGLGRAISHRFAAGGFRIVAVARGQERLDKLAEELSPITDIATLAADASDPQSAKDAAALAISKFGRVDSLINNAGAGRWGKIHETDEALLDEVIELSLKAPFRFAREALPHMKPGSSVVNIGSTWGIVGGVNGGVYCMVKAGLSGLTRAIATDYGPLGVRANLIAPGVIHTEMTDRSWGTERFRRMNHEMTPFHRDGMPEDIADTSYFLCTKGGSYINGQIIALDGGWSMAKYLSPEAILAERVQR